jgi:hypothetical protein
MHCLLTLRRDESDFKIYVLVNETKQMEMLEILNGGRVPPHP